MRWDRAIDAKRQGFRLMRPCPVQTRADGRFHFRGRGKTRFFPIGHGPQRNGMAGGFFPMLPQVLNPFQPVAGMGETRLVDHHALRAGVGLQFSVQSIKGDESFTQGAFRPEVEQDVCRGVFPRNQDFPFRVPIRSAGEE